MRITIRFLCLVASVASCASVPAAPAVVDSVTQADARLALQIASGLATSAPADMVRADVAASAAEGQGPRLTILDAVMLMRGARGHSPVGVTRSALLDLHDQVRLQGPMVRNYTLSRAFRFSGRLLDASGNPVSGSISLEDSRGMQKGFDQFGLEGAFAMAVDGENLHPIASVSYPTADRQGAIYVYTPLSPAEDVSLTTDTRRDFVRPERPPTGFIEGTVLSAGPTVTRVHANVRIGERAQGSTDAQVKDGQFRMECPSGSTSLTLFALSGERTMTNIEFQPRERFEVIAGQTVTRRLRFPALATLSCSVVGRTGWPVMLVSLDSGESETGWLRTTISEPDANGFTMPLWPGSYKAEVLFEKREGVSYWQYGYKSNVTVPENGGETALIVPPETPDRELSGCVTDPSGRPLPGAQVSLFRWHEKDGRFAYTCTETDVHGHYRLTAPEASYTVCVQPRDQLQASEGQRDGAGP